MSIVKVDYGEVGGGTHVETGQCAAMMNYTTPVTFEKPFTSNPTIYIRPIEAPANYPYLSIHGTSYYSNLSTTGMTLKNIYWCKGDFSGYTSGGTIEWIAVGD